MATHTFRERYFHFLVDDSSFPVGHLSYTVGFCRAPVSKRLKVIICPYTAGLSLKKCKANVTMWLCMVSLSCSSQKLCRSNRTWSSESSHMRPWCALYMLTDASRLTPLSHIEEKVAFSTLIMVILCCFALGYVETCGSKTQHRPWYMLACLLAASRLLVSIRDNTSDPPVAFWSKFVSFRFVGDHLYNLSNMQNDAGEFVDLYVPRKWWVLKRF